MKVLDHPTLDRGPALGCTKVVKVLDHPTLDRGPALGCTKESIFLFFKQPLGGLLCMHGEKTSVLKF